MTRFDTTGLSCDIAAEVDVDALLPPHELDEQGGTALRLFRTALAEAVPVDSLDDVEDRRRIAVILGGHGYVPSAEDTLALVRHLGTDGEMDLAALAEEDGYGRHQLTWRLPDVVPALVARLLDARGMSLPIVSACAADAVRVMMQARPESPVAGSLTAMTW